MWAFAMKRQTTPDSNRLVLSDFSFQVPEALIAQTPLESRSASKLLLSRGGHGQPLSNHYVTDLPALLPANSLLILNDSRVFPGRLLGTLDTGGKAEIFLLKKPVGATRARVQALGKPFRKLQPGTKINFDEQVYATILEKVSQDQSISLEVEFNLSAEDFLRWAGDHGHIPLPPYIKRKESVAAKESKDKDRYQTVYAGPEGSVAAPTAGLHFTPELLKKIEEKGVDCARTTLHVGAGTFLPVKHENIDDHKMHEESFLISRETVQKILDAKKEGRPVIGVGTTSFRSVESLFKMAAEKAVSPLDLADQWLQTDLFVRPRSRNQRFCSEIFSALMTNFHQPESTLFMLICSLTGFDRAHEIYRYAIEQEYRFFSYGDSGLFWFD